MALKTLAALGAVSHGRACRPSAGWGEAGDAINAITDSCNFGDQDQTTFDVRFHHALPPDFHKPAAESLLASWRKATGLEGLFPRQCLRHGVGPRYGTTTIQGRGRISWSSSLSHSAAAGAVATALFVQSAAAQSRHGRLTVGVDIELATRVVHPGVGRMITPREAVEAKPVASGEVPLVAVISVKEAIFKADIRQAQRQLASYVWVNAQPLTDGGWYGTATAVGERVDRFRVAVTYISGCWLAVAIATS